MQSEPIEETEATNPFSSGFLERHYGLAHSEKTQGTTKEHDSQATNPFTELLSVRHSEFPNQPAESEKALAKRSASPQDVKITTLHAVSDGLECRLLLIPIVPRSLTITDCGTWLSLNPRDAPPLEGMTISQGPEDVSCELQSPFRCTLYYDTAKDHVLLLNHKSPLSAQRVIDLSGNPTHSAASTIGPFADFPLEPSVWRLGPEGSHQEERSCIIRVYRRPYSLAICRSDAPASVAGQKRLLSGDPASTGAVRPRADGDNVSQPLASPANLQNGELALVASNRASYSLFRMRKLSNTRAACLFEARHSDFTNQVIIVKSLRFDDERDVPYKCETWQREYKIHSQLQSDKIVELLGGDARLSSLYLKKIDAYDLSHRSWCRRATDCKFGGTHDDARRVLVDMATALAYLREQQVLHNDIKASNILYSKDTGAVLIDFGLGTMDSSRPSSGGTPWYVAPEYFYNNIRNSLSDVWALGVVMIYLLNKIPLPDSQLQVKQWVIWDAGNRYPLLYEAVERREAWLRIVNATATTMKDTVTPKTCRTNLEALVARMLADEPDERLSSLDLLEATQRGF